MMPEEARKKIANPDVAVQIVVVSGLILMVVAILVGVVLYFLFRPLFAVLRVPWPIPFVVIAILGWGGYSAGSNMIRRVLTEAVRDQQSS